MGVEDSRMLRAELKRRVEAVEIALPRRPLAEIAALAALARSHGLRPVERLSDGLGRALAHGQAPAALAAWLERMRDAILCEETSEAAADACVAAVVVRLAG